MTSYRLIQEIQRFQEIPAVPVDQAVHHGQEPQEDQQVQVFHLLNYFSPEERPTNLNLQDFQQVQRVQEDQPGQQDQVFLVLDEFRDFRADQVHLNCSFHCFPYSHQAVRRFHSDQEVRVVQQVLNIISCCPD